MQFTERGEKFKDRHKARERSWDFPVVIDRNKGYQIVFPRSQPRLAVYCGFQGNQGCISSKD